MREFRAAVLLPIAAVVALGCAAGTGQGPRSTLFSDEHVRLRLLSERLAWAPGDTALVGVHFGVAPGWHLYGEGRSDTGLPIEVESTLSDGYEALSLVWPAADRHVSEGNVIDQIHEGDVTLLLPIVVPRTAATGSGATVRCAVDWLVCGTGCIPGNGEVEIVLPIERRRGALDREAAPHFAAARARVPRPLPGSDAGVVQAAAHDRWSVRVEGAEEMVFLPSVDCAELVDPVADPVSLSDRLEIRFTRDGEEPRAVRGVLEVHKAGGTAWYRVDAPLPSMNN